jgi:hypothetical protein
MLLEPSLIAAEPAGWLRQDKIGPTRGIAPKAPQHQRMLASPENMLRSCRLKAVTVRSRPGTFFQVPEAHPQESLSAQ